MSNWIKYSLFVVVFLVVWKMSTRPQEKPSYERIMKKAAQKVYQPTDLELPEGVKPITILLFGRTRAGKSSLGNKLSGGSLFEVGDGLESNTTSTKDAIISLKDEKGNDSYLLRIIDTPGFADNRVDRTNEDVLSDILAFMKNLKDGMEIGVYCIPAGSGVSMHDIDELTTISLLLGKRVFEHSIIAVTKINTLTSEQRVDSESRYPQELPQILKNHGLFDFASEKVLFADFENFHEKFVSPFSKFVAGSSNYQPEVPLNLNLSDVDSVRAFFATSAMQELLEKRDVELEEKTKLAELALQTMKETEEKSEKLLREKQEEIEKKKQILYDMSKELEETNSENEELRATQYNMKKSLAKLERERTEVTLRVADIESVVREKEIQLQKLNQQVDELKSYRPTAGKGGDMLVVLLVSVLFLAACAYYKPRFTFGCIMMVVFYVVYYLYSAVMMKVNSLTSFFSFFSS